MKWAGGYQKRSKDEGGAEVLHWLRRGPDELVEVYKLEEFKEKDTMLVGVGSP